MRKQFDGLASFLQRGRNPLAMSLALEAPESFDNMRSMDSMAEEDPELKKIPQIGKPIKRGWLKKKSPRGFGGFRKWQARYFVLYKNQLLYFRKENDIEPAGRVYFSLIQKILKGDNFKVEHRIDILCISHNSRRGREMRKFSLRAYSLEDGESWYQQMVDVALSMNNRQSAELNDGLAQIGKSRMSLEAAHAIQRKERNARRATEIKAEMLGQIIILDELLTGHPRLGNVYRTRIGTSSRRFLLQVVETSTELSKKFEEVHNKARKTLLCRYIMPVVAIGSTADARWLLYDYGGNYSLFRHLRRIGPFPERISKIIIAQVLIALDAIHKEGLLCWNLSPETIYLDGAGNVVLADLQLTVPTGDLKSFKINDYTSPESLQREKYSRESDYWKVGILLYELLHGVPPTFVTSHGAREISEKVVEVAENGPKFPLKISENAKALLNLLLSDKKTREQLDFGKLSSASFFEGINFTELALSGREGEDEWFEYNVCSYCECTYGVYPAGAVKTRMLIPTTVSVNAKDYFEGMQTADVKDEKTLEIPQITPTSRLQVQGEKSPLSRGTTGSSPSSRSLPPPPPQERDIKTTKRVEEKKSFTNILHGVVRKYFRRYQQDGYDLDLSYITPQIIAMSNPSSGNGEYRNPLNDVKRLFGEKHSKGIKVYDLCEESGLNEGAFSYMANYDIEEHQPCCLKTLLDFCEDVQSWLRGKDHAIAVHCNTGKGRTGMAIAAYLTFSQKCANGTEALKFFAEKRTTDRRGVTIPSQRRYVLLFEQFLEIYYWPRPSAPMFQWRRPAVIQHIRLSPVPHYGVIEGCDPYFQVYQNGKELIYSSTIHNEPRKYNKKADKTVELHCNFILAGDNKLVFYNRDPGGSEDTMFAFWIHASFTKNDHICLRKQNLDDAAVNKKNFDPDFKCELFFLPNNSDLRRLHRSLEEHESTRNTALSSSSKALVRGDIKRKFERKFTRTSTV
mmetsp:Transcript_15164/g.22945  ORF Transcript_15164/g.22945 Transcript_15164/m.22945 type:complete len:966 (-) Transcript_15164:218-3115(-)